eukprot:scaffold4862_cov70-Attheya_sp.AAC.3
MSADEVAKAFTQHYYNAFDTNVEGLAGLYVSRFVGDAVERSGEPRGYVGDPSLVYTDPKEWEGEAYVWIHSRAFIPL